MLHFPLLQCQPPSLHPRWSPADPTRGRYTSRETCLPSRIVLKIFSLTQKVFLWKMGLVVVFLIALCSELCSLTGSSFPLPQSKKRRGRPKKQDKVPLIIESDDESEIVSLCTYLYAYHKAITFDIVWASFPDWQNHDWRYECLGMRPAHVLVFTPSSSSSHRSLRTMLFLQPPPTTLPRSPLLPHFPQDERDYPSNHSNTWVVVVGNNWNTSTP